MDITSVEKYIMVKISPANLYTPKTSHKFMKSMASGGLARFIALEAFVEAGRTYQAYKRGGFDEGRERITEEFTGAVFWLGGVKVFNAINDKIGKKLLNMRTAKFDVGVDRARNPVANFINAETSTKDAATKFTDKQLAKFKAVKLIASILMANTMIGFVVPKINQRITRYYHRNDKNLQQLSENNQPNMQQMTEVSMPRENMEEYINKASSDKKEVPFGSAFNMMSLAYNLEHNTTWQLLSTDVGTATGRTISARNNNERREILFRDLSSIFFYMFNMPLINAGLNKLEQKGRSTRLDSMNADYTSDIMKQIIKENGGSITAERFTEEMFGLNKDFKLPEAFKNNEFKEGFMNIDEFMKHVETLAPDKAKVDEYKEIAQAMAKLQPAVEGKERITAEQAERVFKGGYLNNPEFLKNLYEIEFGKNKKAGLANFLDPYKFISNDSVESVNDDLSYFVKQIAEKAGKAKKEITEEVIEKAVKSNFKYNVLNWGAGFGVSALFLSTLIPKMQYWLTKHYTGYNAFPGTEEYRKQQAEQATNL